MTKKKKSEIAKIELPMEKHPPEVSVEEADKKISEVEEKLRKMGIERDVLVKKPIDIDPSFHFFFTKLKDPQGTLMLKQHAGMALRLLEAPPYLKRGVIRHLDDLLESVALGQKKGSAEKEAEPEKTDEPKKPGKAKSPKKSEKKKK